MSFSKALEINNLSNLEEYRRHKKMKSNKNIFKLISDKSKKQNTSEAKKTVVKSSISCFINEEINDVKKGIENKNKLQKRDYSKYISKDGKKEFNEARNHQ